MKNFFKIIKAFGLTNCLLLLSLHVNGKQMNRRKAKKLLRAPKAKVVMVEEAQQQSITVIA